jgi:c-di-GMP-binding flagellar brake protein YcgR
MVGERRSSPRQIVNSPIYVSLGLSAGGFLCDLSEGGLAIELLGGTLRDQVVRVGFDLPNTGYRIEAIGQISWTNESARRAGLEFVEIARGTRRRIGHWISLQKRSRMLPSRYLNGT